MNSKVVSPLTATRFVLRWSIISGLVSALFTLIANPDTSHYSGDSLGVIAGIIGAVFGALAGVLFKLLVLRIPFVQRFGRIGLLLIGAVVGAIVGGIAWITMARTLWTMVIAVLLGAVLGLLYKGWRSDPEATGGPTT